MMRLNKTQVVNIPALILYPAAWHYFDAGQFFQDVTDDPVVLIGKFGYKVVKGIAPEAYFWGGYRYFFQFQRFFFDREINFFIAVGYYPAVFPDKHTGNGYCNAVGRSRVIQGVVASCISSCKS